MKTQRLFHETKTFPAIEKDKAEWSFTAIHTSDYAGLESFDYTILDGRFRVGHYVGYDGLSWCPSKIIKPDSYLQVIDTYAKTDAEILREVIRRADWWLSECQDKIALAIGQGNQKSP